MFSNVMEEILWDKKKGIPIAANKQSVLKFKTNQFHSGTNYKFLKLDSEAFDQNGIIPSKFTCDGVNVNPAININGLPEEAKTLALIVDDPNGVNGTFCHWLIWNLPVTDRILEGEHRGLPGRNDFGFYKYNGPCPPVGTHHYYFKVYALDCILNIPACSGKLQLETAMKDHVVGFGFLVGKYHMRT